MSDWIEGEAMGGAITVFRPGAASVRLVVLANHKREATHVLEMDNLVLERLDGVDVTPVLTFTGSEPG